MVTFTDTFGPKAQRKRPRIGASMLKGLGKLGAAAAEEAMNAKATAELTEASAPVAMEQTQALYRVDIARRGTYMASCTRSPTRWTCFYTYWMHGIRSARSAFRNASEGKRCTSRSYL